MATAPPSPSIMDNSSEFEVLCLGGVFKLRARWLRRPYGRYSKRFTNNLFKRGGGSLRVDSYLKFSNCDYVYRIASYGHLKYFFKTKLNSVEVCWRKVVTLTTSLCLRFTLTKDGVKPLFYVPGRFGRLLGLGSSSKLYAAHEAWRDAWLPTFCICFLIRTITDRDCAKQFRQ